MKKYTVIIAGLVMFSLSLAAQNQRDESAQAIEAFNRNFPEAQNVRWTLMEGQVRKAHFGYQGKSCLAFFSAKGEMICSGKKVYDLSTLPQLAAQSLERQKSRLEKKVGALSHHHTFEIITGNTTKYFSTLGNEKVIIIVSVDPNGNFVIESRKINKSAPEIKAPAPKEVIAKQ